MKKFNLFSRLSLMTALTLTAASASAGYIAIPSTMPVSLPIKDSEKFYIMYNDQTGQASYQVYVDFELSNAWIYSTDNGAVVDSVVTIPDFITVDGRNYPIVSIGNTRANRHGCYARNNMSTLVLGKNIERIDSMGVSNNAALKKIVWNDKIHTLGAYAFRDCASLSTFILPSTLKKIEGNLFINCPAMRKIDASANPEFLVENDVCLYSKDKSVFYCILDNQKASAYTIPAECKELASGLFMMWNLKSIDFSNVEIINEYCITNSKIDNLKIPATLKHIGNGFNYANKTLKTIEVDPANTYFTVENNILYNKVDGWIAASIATATDIATLTLPEGVKAVGDYQFYYFKNIKKLVMPTTLEYIGERGFVGCENLEEANFENTKLAIINKLAFQSTALRKVVFPSTLGRVENQAFYKVPSLDKLELNEGLQLIGFYSFAGSGVSKLVIPSTLTKCYSSPFKGCDELLEVEIKGRVVPETIFEACWSIEKVTLHEGLEEIGNKAFAITISLNGDNGATPYSNFETIKFPSTLKKIGDLAFYQNIITKVELPESCKTLGYGAFANSNYMTSFVTKGLDTIEAKCLQSSPYLTEFKLNDGVTYVGAMVVSGVNMRTFTLPASVKKFGGQMTVLPGLKDGTADTLLDWHVYAPIPPEIFKVNSGNWFIEADAYTSSPRQGVMYNTNLNGAEYKSVILSVPAASVEAYKNHPFWGKIQNIIALQESGVEDVDVDNYDSPAIYYNMQGIRVSEPLPGSIYVKVQGGKTEKIIY